jgi:hypothetical protein
MKTVEEIYEALNLEPPVEYARRAMEDGRPLGRTTKMTIEAICRAQEESVVIIAGSPGGACKIGRIIQAAIETIPNLKTDIKVIAAPSKSEVRRQEVLSRGRNERWFFDHWTVERWSYPLAGNHPCHCTIKFREGGNETQD